MNNKTVFLVLAIVLFLIGALLALGTVTGSVNAMVFVAFGLASLATSLLP